MRKILIAAAVFAVCFGADTSTVFADQPIVIAHRGASGYRPEHTLGAYELAVQQGADYVEPDLVVTKDGHFVARHDVYLSTTTDVAERPEFADRKRTIQGKADWFVFDFTLAELKTLRTIQPRTSRGQQFDGQETIPTLGEIVELVKGRTVNGKQVGLHIELKRPDVFGKMNAGMTQSFIAALDAVRDAGIPLFFQCFDPEFTVEIAKQTDHFSVLLVSGKMSKDTRWYEPTQDIMSYIDQVDGFGLFKALLIDQDRYTSGLLEKIQAAGKPVHIWTIRDDQVPNGFNRVEDELTLFYKMGVDGVFADFPDTAVKVRDALTTEGLAQER